MLKIFFVISMLGQNVVVKYIPIEDGLNLCFELAEAANSDIENEFADPTNLFIFNGIRLKKSDVVVSCHITSEHPKMFNSKII